MPVTSICPALPPAADGIFPRTLKKSSSLFRQITRSQPRSESPGRSWRCLSGPVSRPAVPPTRACFETPWSALTSWVSQRQQALQSFLSSGQSVGDQALNIYNTTEQQRRANQQSALSYLGSGATPYQVASGYVQNAEASAAGAAQGGPQYNPASLGQGIGGTSQQAPAYGLNMSQQAQQWYNSMSQYLGGGGPQKNKTASALSGAASGAMSGATAGSVFGIYGTAIGAIVGGAAGGLGGYYG